MPGLAFYPVQIVKIITQSTYIGVGMHIVYVGYPGFPKGQAQVERQKLIAIGLKNCGCDVTVISRYGVFDEHKSDALAASGYFEGIRYKFASGISYRPANFLKRNIYKAQGLVKELFLIWKYSSSGKLDVVLITTNSFYNVLLYSLIAFLCRVPSVLDNVEYFSSIKVNSIWQKLDYALYDRFAYKLVSKVICISDFLLDIVREGSPNKPMLKVPAIVDYLRFAQSYRSQEPYFLFCGSAVYYEIIDFIITSYEKLGQDSYQLCIVSNGNPEQMLRIKNRISQSSQKRSIKLLSDLSYNHLTQLYIGSKALLIPLLDRKQDIARFPHKVGEYCAAGRVIISTKIGEVAAYFKDQENALLAESPDPLSFSRKMQYVMDYPERAEEIAINSYLTGKTNFDHTRLGERIFRFLTEKASRTIPVAHHVEPIK
jgi:glycosyltransferase involved in cell wall biosynthesis